jgi:excisionase family DNA binding protein
MTTLGTFYTIGEAAKISRLSPPTIRRAIRRHELSAVRPTGRRRVLIPAIALEVFLYGAGGAPMTTGRFEGLATELESAV